MSITQRPFGVTSEGIEVIEFTMKNSSGVSVSVISYGAALTRIIVPDFDGNPVDISLAYDTLAEYEQDNIFLGAICGRFANRIANSAFTLNGESFRLNANDGKNHLHGGSSGFYTRVWDASEKDGAVEFHRVSADQEELYPGNLDVFVTYRLTDSGELFIDYRATTDRDTILNLTNHAYFNLSGHDSGVVYDQIMNIFAKGYLPIDENSIPTGEIAPVADTPFDFRSPKAIGCDIDADDEQLHLASGYDHTFVLYEKSGKGGLRPAASARSPKTGIRLDIYTTQPSIQFYSANFLTERKGLNGAVYNKRGAFCLETQHFPDSPNKPNFPSVLLKTGENFHETTVYNFGVYDPQKSPSRFS